MVRPLIIAGMVLVVGAACFVYFLIRQLGSIDKDFVRVTVPGDHLVELKQAGDYTIFHEFRSVIGNRVYSAPETISGLECSLVSDKTGHPIQLLPSSSSSHYEFGGRSGVSILNFEIGEPGLYRFSGRYASGNDGPVAVLTMEHGFLKKILFIVFPALGILFGTIFLSVSIVVLTIIRQRSATNS